LVIQISREIIYTIFHHLYRDGAQPSFEWQHPKPSSLTFRSFMQHGTKGTNYKE
jgi:hypothetical protein